MQFTEAFSAVFFSRCEMSCLSFVGFNPQQNAYRTLSNNLKQFEAINSLPPHLKRRCERFETVEDIYNDLFSNEEVFHKSCSCLYNKQKLDRKRKSISLQQQPSYSYSSREGRIF